MVRYIFILVAVLLSARAAPAATWADALFNELSHDFGALPRGNVGMHTFRIVNTTKQPVHIASVRVSCGCVSASIARADLAPGEETYLAARIDSRIFAGVTHKTIYVLFDRPELTEVKLEVQANSRDDLFITPDSVALGQVAHGSRPEGSVTVSIARQGSVNVLGVTSESGFIEPKVTAVNPDAGEASFRLTVQVRPDLPVGRWYTNVWMTTSDPAVPRLAVPVTVEVTEPRPSATARK